MCSICHIKLCFEIINTLFFARIYSIQFIFCITYFLVKIIFPRKNIIEEKVQNKLYSYVILFSYNMNRNKSMLEDFQNISIKYDFSYGFPSKTVFCLFRSLGFYASFNKEFQYGCIIKIERFKIKTTKSLLQFIHYFILFYLHTLRRKYITIKSLKQLKKKYNNILIIYMKYVKICYLKKLMLEYE